MGQHPLRLRAFHPPITASGPAPLAPLPVPRTLAPMAVLASLALLSACSSGGPSAAERDRMRTEGESIFGGGEAGDPRTRGVPAAPWAMWSIVLGVYSPDDRIRAQENLEWIRTVGGLGEARLERRSNGMVIAYGIYSGADDPKAQEALARLREMVIDSKRPYAGAVLAPPTAESVTGSNAAWDLARVRADRGPNAIYTLQIGLYGRADSTQPTAAELREFRAKAEEAVRELRAKGEEAYYFHSPRRSTVTIGVFGQADYDPLNLPGYRSPPLARAWEAYPHNLLNGQAIRERIPGTEQQRLQASSLVRIPE